jgi:hypothetical protein
VTVKQEGLIKNTLLALHELHKLQITASWDVTACSLVEIYHKFGSPIVTIFQGLGFLSNNTIHQPTR